MTAAGAQEKQAGSGSAADSAGQRLLLLRLRWPPDNAQADVRRRGQLIVGTACLVTLLPLLLLQ